MFGAEPLKDYSFIRGVCYPGGWMGKQDIIERDLGYAQRMQLNSTRIWLSYQAYERNPTGFIEQLRNYVRTAYKLGITTMPILWNGNMIDPAILEDSFKSKGEAYVKAVVEALKNEEGLIVWDIMNEPLCNEYYSEAPTEQEQAVRAAKIWKFVRHYCGYVKKLDSKTAITVGVTYPDRLEHTADLVDVLSFHDYLETRQRVEASYELAEKVSTKYKKPLINSEMACIGRANPYDMALEICRNHKVGFYVFDLICSGYWGDVHGLVYPDGTVRDPAVIAALLGFYRNRDLSTSIKPNPNKEGHAYQVLRMIEEALKDETKLFRNKKNSTDNILEAAEYCANLLEASEAVPMYEPPTAKIQTWRKQKEEDRDLEAIRQFAYDLAQILKAYCKIL
jgi:hypothetical protein